MASQETSLRLAEAEREKRRRSQQATVPEPAQEELRPAPQRFAESVARTVGGLADIPYDVVVRGPYELAQMAAGRRGEEVDVLPQFSSYAPQSQGTPLETATEFATEGVALASAVPLRVAQTPAQLYQMSGKYPGIAKSFIEGIVNTTKSIGRDIVQTKARDPGAFIATEALMSGGAGAGTQMAQDAGMGETGQLLTGVGGGMIAGTVMGIPRTLTALKQGIQTTLFPMTAAGGEIRAARQMQARAGGPERAEILAERLKDMPEGMTPAQYLGDDLLLAQQQRILKDDPELAVKVANELAETKILLQNTLDEFAGTPATQQDWEMSILGSIVPEGTVIKRGATDTMLNQAYKSFDPLYAEARGIDINIPEIGAQLDIPMPVMPRDVQGAPRPLSISSVVTSAAQDSSVIASDESRNTIYRYLNNLQTKYIDSVKNGVIKSDDILSMRSDIRTRMRDINKGVGNQEYVDLLSMAESNLTALLDAGLPDKAKQVLRGADLRYRKYKVYENAVYRSGDKKLSPEMVSESIRTGMTSPSRYARGVDPQTQEMRQLAMSGQDFEQLIGNPTRAQRIVRDMTPEQRKLAQADFLKVLTDKAVASGTEMTDVGKVLIDGETLLKNVYENRATLRALGVTPKEIQNLTRMSQEVIRMQKKSPEAVVKLFEDGPSSLMELGATLIGAKQGQNLAGSGLGSSLVLASYMTNRARKILSNLTSDQAAKIMVDATTDAKLYRALLTKSVQRPASGKEQAKYLESYLYQSGFGAEQEGEQ
jgi:hypothetical protein